jgi:hypothetical protein
MLKEVKKFRHKSRRAVDVEGELKIGLEKSQVG